MDYSRYETYGYRGWFGVQRKIYTYAFVTMLPAVGVLEAKLALEVAQGHTRNLAQMIFLLPFMLLPIYVVRRAPLVFPTVVIERSRFKISGFGFAPQLPWILLQDIEFVRFLPRGIMAVGSSKLPMNLVAPGMLAGHEWRIFLVTPEIDRYDELRERLLAIINDGGGEAEALE